MAVLVVNNLVCNWRSRNISWLICVFNVVSVIVIYDGKLSAFYIQILLQYFSLYTVIIILQFNKDVYIIVIITRHDVSDFYEFVNLHARDLNISHS